MSFASRLASRFGLPALPALGAFLFAAASAGCFSTLCGQSMSEASGSGSQDAGAGGFSSQPSATPSENVARTVAEADIIQLDDEHDLVYAMSRSGHLTIVDAQTPGSLVAKGTIGLSGVPFEMFRRGDTLLVMANGAVDGGGSILPPTNSGAEITIPSATSGALLTAIDAKDPSAPRTMSMFPVAGEIADSRLVGNILYLVTYENGACYQCGSQRTLVTSFDVSDPTSPRRIDEVAFGAQPELAYPSSVWAAPWKRSVFATSERLYVGGSADLYQYDKPEGRIHVLDIHDPSGKIVAGATLDTPGPIMSRWQMDEHDGVFRVVSQHGAGTTQNGTEYPEIDTFTVTSAQTISPLGHLQMRLPRQEGLKTVRFDGTRGYAITFANTDPLFTLDFADPAHPVQRGELVIPGWVFHLEPRGDKLVGLGLDARESSGVLNVSLFDVADMDNPTMIRRLNFGPSQVVGGDQAITQGVMAEDQDRIHKAFRIYQDGLIAVPYSAGSQGFGYGATDSCTSAASGVQLITMTGTTLAKAGFLSVPGNPRRVFRRDSQTMREIIAVSDSNMNAFTIDDVSAPSLAASLRIGTCVPKNAPSPGGGWGGDRWEGPSGDVSMSEDSCF